MINKVEECELFLLAKASAAIGLILTTLSLILVTYMSLNFQFVIIGIFFIFSYGILLHSLIERNYSCLTISHSFLISNIILRFFGCLYIIPSDHIWNKMTVFMVGTDVLIIFYSIFALLITTKVQKSFIEGQLAAAQTTLTLPPPSIVINEDSISKASAPFEE